MANELVKQAYNDDELSEEQIVEWLKCANDCEYFLSNYVKVQHPTRGAVYFNLYGYQQRVLGDLLSQEKNIVLQPRQSGKTILLTGYLLWKAVFNKDISIGVAAHKGAGAKEIVARFKYAYEFLPTWMKPGVKAYNVFDVEFDNGSSIISQSTTPTTFRGMSMSIIYLDEFAFVPPRIADEFWTSLLPSMSAGEGENQFDEDGNELKPVKLIATSTPNGSEGLFARLWFQAEQGENSTDDDEEADAMFHPSRVYNDEVPGRDEKFKKKILRGMTPLQYSQEFDCAFLSNKGTLISSQHLESIKGLDPEYERLGIRFFKENNIRGRRLALSVDVAEGIGGTGDYTVIQIFDIDRLEQVGEWRDNEVTISDFTKFFIGVLQMLDNQGAREIYYTVESNPIGLSVLNLLDNSTSTILDKVECISDSYKRKGILTTNKSKLAGCTMLKDFMESDRLTIYSKQLISELKFFVKKGASFSAEIGMHDDLVMATVIFMNMLIQLAKMDDDISDTVNKINTIDCYDESDLQPMPFLF